MEKVLSKYEHLSEDLILCEHIPFPEGELLEVYIGMSGIYVISEPVENYESLYIALRNLFGTSRFKLYIQNFGEYNVFSSAFRAFQNTEELSAAVNDYVLGDSCYFDETARSKLCTTLMHICYSNHGIYKDSDGTTYISRHGKLKEVSPHSSSLNFILTLFGGTLGLHQFALHKFGLGLFYLCTGGGFMLGWLMDLIFLFLGIQKDKQKRYLRPLEHRFKKLLLVPFGIIFGSFLFTLYLLVSKSFEQATNLLLDYQLRTADPLLFENFYNGLRNFAERLSN